MHPASSPPLHSMDCVEDLERAFLEHVPDVLAIGYHVFVGRTIYGQIPLTDFDPLLAKKFKRLYGKIKRDGSHPADPYTCCPVFTIKDASDLEALFDLGDGDPHFPPSKARKAFEHALGDAKEQTWNHRGRLLQFKICRPWEGLAERIKMAELRRSIAAKGMEAIRCIDELAGLKHKVPKDERAVKRALSAEDAKDAEEPDAKRSSSPGGGGDLDFYEVARRAITAACATEDLPEAPAVVVETPE